MSRTLFTGGLSYKTTQEDLRTYFSKFGEIDKVEVSRHPSGLSKGFAFVFFHSQKSVTRVLATKNHQMHSRRMDCQRAKTKHQKAEYHNMIKDCRLFVGGLATRVTDEQLKRFCAGFGEIKTAYIIKDHSDSKSLGFGYALFKDPEVASRLVSMGAARMGAEKVKFCRYRPHKGGRRYKGAGKGRKKGRSRRRGNGDEGDSESEYELANPVREVKGKKEAEGRGTRVGPSRTSLGVWRASMGRRVCSLAFC